MWRSLSLRVYLCVWIGIYFHVAYIRTLYHRIPQQVYSTYLFIQVYDYVFRWEICVGSSLAGFVDGFQFAHILSLDIGQGFGNNLQHGSHVTNPKAFWVYISVCMYVYNSGVLHFIKFYCCIFMITWVSWLSLKHSTWFMAWTVQMPKWNIFDLS